MGGAPQRSRVQRSTLDKRQLIRYLKSLRSLSPPFRGGNLGTTKTPRPRNRKLRLQSLSWTGTKGTGQMQTSGLRSFFPRYLARREPFNT
jgi:hypothetical protein